LRQIALDYTSDIANTNSEHPVDKLHKLVVENGGTFSMNLSSIVTHAIAFEKKGKMTSVVHVSRLRGIVLDAYFILKDSSFSCD